MDLVAKNRLAEAGVIPRFNLGTSLFGAEIYHLQVKYLIPEENAGQRSISLSLTHSRLLFSYSLSISYINAAGDPVLWCRCAGRMEITRGTSNNSLPVS